MEVVETYSDALSSWNNKGHIVMACAYQEGNSNFKL